MFKFKILVFLVVFLFVVPVSSTSTFLQLEKVFESESFVNEKDLKICEIINKANRSLIEDFLNSFVEIGPKLTGTYGCRKTAVFLKNQFKMMGLKVKSYNWSSYEAIWNLRSFFKIRFFNGENIEATLPGRYPDKPCIIFSAHYDTVRVSPGANDDGSGITAMLTAAYTLSHYKFDRTIKFVAFSGEEIGLRGSRSYVKYLHDSEEDVLVSINADMIGYANSSNGGKEFRLGYTNGARWMSKDIESLNKVYDIGFENISFFELSQDAIIGHGDYFNFVKYGYECVSFWQQETNKKYYHTANDTIEHINFSYLTNMTKLIISGIVRFADIEVLGQPNIRIVSPKKGKIYDKDLLKKDLTLPKFTILPFRITRIFDNVDVYAEVRPGVYNVDYVCFYYDDKEVFNTSKKPFIYILDNVGFGFHEIKAEVCDKNGGRDTDQIKIFSFR